MINKVEIVIKSTPGTTYAVRVTSCKLFSESKDRPIDIPVFLQGIGNSLTILCLLLCPLKSNSNESVNPSNSLDIHKKTIEQVLKFNRYRRDGQDHLSFFTHVSFDCDDDNTLKIKGTSENPVVTTSDNSDQEYHGLSGYELAKKILDKFDLDNDNSIIKNKNKFYFDILLYMRQTLGSKQTVLPRTSQPQVPSVTRSDFLYDVDDSVIAKVNALCARHSAPSWPSDSLGQKTLIFIGGAFGSVKQWLSTKSLEKWLRQLQPAGPVECEVRLVTKLGTSSMPAVTHDVSIIKRDTFDLLTKFFASHNNAYRYSVTESREYLIPKQWVADALGESHIVFLPCHSRELQGYVKADTGGKLRLVNIWADIKQEDLVAMYKCMGEKNIDARIADVQKSRSSFLDDRGDILRWTVSLDNASTCELSTGSLKELARILHHVALTRRKDEMRSSVK